MRDRPDATTGRTTRRDYRHHHSPLTQTRDDQEDNQSSADDDRLLPCPCASLAGLVYVIEAKTVLWRELVIVDRVLCATNEHIVYTEHEKGCRVLTVFNVRWLLESCDLNQCETVLRKVLVRHAYSCLEALLRLRELLALHQAQTSQPP